MNSHNNLRFHSLDIFTVLRSVHVSRKCIKSAVNEIHNLCNNSSFRRNNGKMRFKTNRSWTTLFQHPFTWSNKRSLAEKFGNKLVVSVMDKVSRNFLWIAGAFPSTIIWKLYIYTGEIKHNGIASLFLYLPGELRLHLSEKYVYACRNGRKIFAALNFLKRERRDCEITLRRKY